MTGVSPQTYLKVYALLPVTDVAQHAELSAAVRTRISPWQMMKIKFDLRSDKRVAADLPEGICPTACHCFGRTCGVERRAERSGAMVDQ